MFGVDLWENEEIVTDFRGQYATDVFTDKALEVIEKHNTSKVLLLYSLFTITSVLKLHCVFS